MVLCVENLKDLGPRSILYCIYYIDTISNSDGCLGCSWDYSGLDARIHTSWPIKAQKKYQ
ncbi:hypothetical protein CsSME_00053716 [Camellia sinensis var. sinensis]